MDQGTCIFTVRYSCYMQSLLNAAGGVYFMYHDGENPAKLNVKSTVESATRSCCCYWSQSYSTSSKRTIAACVCSIMHAVQLHSTHTQYNARGFLIRECARVCINLRSWTTIQAPVRHACSISKERQEWFSLYSFCISSHMTSAFPCLFHIFRVLIISNQETS